MKIKLFLILITLYTSLYAATVKTQKESYKQGEQIIVTIKQMLGHSEDWVGIYPANSNNDWENVLSWSWTGGVKNAEIKLDGVVAGEYEVRAFYRNSFDLEAKYAFSVGRVQTTVKPQKDSYDNGEEIIVEVAGMLGHYEDWVGIYPANSNNDWENVLSWSWTDGVKNGKIRLSGLPVGEYEVRAFFKNSFDLEAKYAFNVKRAYTPPIIYEDAEGGISSKWIHVLGKYPPRRLSGGYNSSSLLLLNPQWKDLGYKWENFSEYHLPINNSVHSILEIDMGGSNYLMPQFKGDNKKRGWMEHYTVGLYVKTKKGDRIMLWDSFFNHENVDPHVAEYGNGVIWLIYPSPVEHVRGWGFEDPGVWTHFKVDINVELQKLEPDNKLLYIDKFMATGGFLDNIKLSSP